MDVTNINLFNVAEQRLAWAEQRQSVLAQNVANVNTPGYRAKDLTPFASALATVPALRLTTPLHLSGSASSPGGGTFRVVGQPRTPNGNEVSLEDQLVQVADTSSAQELTLNLYRRYQGMFRVALGRGG